MAVHPSGHQTFADDCWLDVVFNGELAGDAETRLFMEALERTSDYAFHRNYPQDQLRPGRTVVKFALALHERYGQNNVKLSLDWVPEPRTQREFVVTWLRTS
jgi:hypothetical protein